MDRRQAKRKSRRSTIKQKRKDAFVDRHKVKLSNLALTLKLLKKVSLVVDREVTQVTDKPALLFIGHEARNIVQEMELNLPKISTRNASPAFRKRIKSLEEKSKVVAKKGKKHCDQVQRMLKTTITILDVIIELVGSPEFRLLLSAITTGTGAAVTATAGTPEAAVLATGQFGFLTKLVIRTRRLKRQLKAVQQISNKVCKQK